jgi:hypothetical protein
MKKPGHLYPEKLALQLLYKDENKNEKEEVQ